MRERFECDGREFDSYLEAVGYAAKLDPPPAIHQLGGDDWEEPAPDEARVSAGGGAGELAGGLVVALYVLAGLAAVWLVVTFLGEAYADGGAAAVLAIILGLHAHRDRQRLTGRIVRLERELAELRAMD